MFDKLWKGALSVAILALVGGGIAYWLSLPERREMTPLMEQLAAGTSKDFAEQVPRVRSVDTVLFIVAGRGRRDEEQQFRSMLTESVRSSAKYRIRTWEDVEDFADDSWLLKAQEKLGMVRGTQPVSLQQATALGKRLFDASFPADGVLFVDVSQFTEGPNQDGLGAEIAVEGSLYSLRTKQVEAEVPEEGAIRHGITSRWDLRYLSYQLSETSWFLRFLVWIAVSAGLPWLLIAVVRAVVRRKQNELNVTLLAALTLVDVLLAWILVTALGGGGGTVLALLLLGGLTGYYNYDACDYIERRLL